MFKRIIVLALAAVMLAAVVPASGEDVAAISCDALSGASVENGAVAASLGTTANELLSCFNDRRALTLTDASGTALDGTAIVASGALVTRGENSVTVVVPGDVDCNAKINARDVVCAMRVIVGTADGVCAAAIDVEADGSANGRDIVKLMKYLVGWNETLGAGREKAANEDDDLTLYFTSTMLRIEEIDTTVYGKLDGLVRMAKNEIEDAHIMLLSTGAKDGLTLEVGDIKNAAGDVLEREVRYGYYYTIGMMDESYHQSSGGVDWQSIHMGRYADPYPTLNAPFAVGANTSKSFLVKIKTAVDTAAGWYSAPVVVRDSAGRELKKATLRVYVWDFALDVTPACKTLFGLSSSFVAGNCGIYDGGKWNPIYYNDWYGYAVENRISVYNLPNGEYRDMAMDDPRVTAFVSAEGSRVGSDFDDPTWVNGLKSTYAHLSQKQEWLDKAYIYDVDEPWGPDGARVVKDQWEKAKAALPDTHFKVILPLTSNCWIDTEQRDMLEASWDYCNAICPQSNCFTISAPRKERLKDKDTYPVWGEYMNDDQLAKYGQFRPRYEQLRERGDDMWWYICIGPQPPYANWLMYQQGFVNRTVLWQQYYYDIDGILYWAMTFWEMGEKDPRGINLKRINNGDGLLLYNGGLWGEDTLPVPSIRLEEVRDGIEDFQYLRQLERESGRDAAMEFTTRVTTDILRYSDDYHDIENTRRDMGFELESLNAAH